MNNEAQNGEKSIIGAIKIDKKEVQEHMDKLVRESVEEVLNKLLNAEADAICNASRYERSPDRLQYPGKHDGYDQSTRDGDRIVCR